MPTPCTMVGKLAAGRPNCWASTAPAKAAAIITALVIRLLGITTSLLLVIGFWRRGCRRFAAGQNIVQIIVRGQPLGSQHIDSLVDRNANLAAVLIHPCVGGQNVVFLGAQLLYLLVG